MTKQIKEFSNSCLRQFENHYKTLSPVHQRTVSCLFRRPADTSGVGDTVGDTVGVGVGGAVGSGVPVGSSVTGAAVVGLAVVGATVGPGAGVEALVGPLVVVGETDGALDLDGATEGELDLEGAVVGPVVSAVVPLDAEPGTGSAVQAKQNGPFRLSTGSVVLGQLVPRKELL
jgi:hypothetical protein